MTLSDLQSLQTFLRVVQTGSFTATAAELGVGQPAVSKAVKRLERDLSVRLLERTSHGVHATEAGERLVHRAQELLDLAREAEAEVRQLHREPMGRLRVALPSGFGLRVVVPLLESFARQAPRVELDLQLSDAWVDLVAEGADLAVRIGHLGDSTLMARRLATTRRYLVASAAWALTHGLPQAPDDLAQCDCVVFSGARDRHHWTVQRGDTVQRVRVDGPWRANHIDAVRAGILAGRGIGLLPDWGCADALADGRLIRVLPDWEGQPLPIHALWVGGRAVPAKTRAFIDFLHASLA